MKRYLILLLLQLCCTVASFAQTDTIYPGSRHLNTALLQPGQRQYLVYFQWPQFNKILQFSYWVRDVSIEQRNGQPVFAIRQHWYTTDTSKYCSFLSLNSTRDFTPIYHAASNNGKTAAYNWSSDRITGADTVQGNAQQDFELAFDRPVFNWNLDIETFEMLPLADGKRFAISFYDAGLSPPAFVLYQVNGSEMLHTLDRRQVDCWKLVTQGTDPRGKAYSQTFWISKKGHELLKEEDAFDGRYRYKVRLPGLTPDILQHFRM
ncbi:hypothetical protein [uncultured Chitinophaga sp.]|jgi:hypothetical protein|uniref:DUF3108 domain-containing protein n=1 Tax=uncultured Chitinophaga sp. TaxID=339340 RepID=UPI0026338C6B|nr:hypothetical protein [uncultured Chitinophaga sp.]